MDDFIPIAMKEKRELSRFEVYRFVKMKLEKRTVICLIKNVSDSGGFLEIEKHYKGEVHKEDKGKIAEFCYLSEFPESENTFYGKIIRYYKEKNRKFIGVEFI